MDIFYFVLQCTGMILLMLLICFVAGFIVQTLVFILKKPKLKGVRTIKRKIIRTFKYLRNKRFWSPYEFLKWVVIDTFRGRPYELFGIWAFAGYYGEGKTLGAVNFAKRLKGKYPDIHLFSNFNLKGQEGKITHWEDLCNLPPRSIVLFDEIQSTFTSTKFKDFPIELLWKLTQCRKNQLAIFCTSPVYSRMSIQLRESVDYVILCKNMFKLKRWFRYSFYKSAEYEKYQEDKIKLRLHREMIFNFVAQDASYHSYDTHQIVDRLDIEEKPIKIRSVK